MGQIPSFGAPPPDSSLTISGKAADAKVVGDKITSLSNSIDTINNSIISTNNTLTNLSNGLGGIRWHNIYMNDHDSSFCITANEDTTGQYYRQYFIVYMIDQSGSLFCFTLVWRGPSGSISVGTIHGSGTVSHSNGTISCHTNTGGWGVTYVLWGNPNLTIS